MKNRLLLGAVCTAAFLSLNASTAEFAPKTFGYVLQADSLNKNRAEAVKALATCDRDLLVLDANFTGGKGGAWTRTELASIRAARTGRRIVAYLSIGEAGDYRDYWRNDWVRSGQHMPGAPAWLCAPNPDWKGNYRVKYWHAEWQGIMLRALDGIVAADFDGVYLDIVDGFEFFEQDGKKFIDDRANVETKQSYRRDMVAWVLKLAKHARAARPGFLVIPQNGSQLLAHADFVAAVDAIGIEDLFTNGNKAQPKSHTSFTLANLKPLKAAGKPVLVIEYSTQAKLQQIARDQAREHELVLLLTDRQLKTLGQSRASQ